MLLLINCNCAGTVVISGNGFPVALHMNDIGTPATDAQTYLPTIREIQLEFGGSTKLLAKVGGSKECT